MKIGSLVTVKNCDRSGTVIKTTGDLLEVRLLSGSLIIAHKSYFIGSGGTSYVASKRISSKNS